MANVKKGRVSLERALSKLGIASRTEASALILSGKVKVHGSIELNPKRQVNPDTAHIELSGTKAVKGESRLFIFHKPKNCLTTKRDPEGRPTIYDYFPAELQSFHAVGRLDQNTTGLLLITNDTRLSNWLTDPKNEIPRTYLVEVRGELFESERLQALNGIEDDGDILIAKEIRILKASGKESRFEIILHEGKNREIRRLCLSLGHEVTALKRLQFGDYELGDLKSAALKEVQIIK
jgi:23S rRNA pseudouridine2605 synthase